MRKTSIRLFVIWLIAFFTVGMAVVFYSIYYSTYNGFEEMEIPDMGKTIVGLIALLVFCPTLGAISVQAKREKAKTIMIISLCLLVFICICVIPNMISLLCP